MFNSSLNPLAVNMVPTVTEWTSYTPTIGGGLGTVTGVSAQWRRVGSNMEVQGEFIAGTVSASPGTITLPAGYTILDNTPRIYGITSVIDQVPGTLWYSDSTTLRTGLNANSYFVSSVQSTFTFTAPISGWAANNVANSATFSGKLVQLVSASTTAVGTTSTVIPDDDTIPTNTEGEEILTCAITPTSASSKIKISFHCPVVYSGTGNPIAELFVDSVSDAIFVGHRDTSGIQPITFVYEESAGSTSTRTYKVRAGAHVGSLYWNQTNAGRKFGGVSKIELILEEILP